MEFANVTIGMEVVRSKGDLVGLVSTVTELDTERKRVKTTYGTWVRHDYIEPAATPYEIIIPKIWGGTGDGKKSKYVRK